MEFLDLELTMTGSMESRAYLKNQTLLYVSHILVTCKRRLLLLIFKLKANSSKDKMQTRFSHRVI